MFGSGVNKDIFHETSFKRQDQSMSMLSQNTTNDQSRDVERINKIMSDPIENIVSNLSNYTHSSTKIRHLS